MKIQATKKYHYQSNVNKIYWFNLLIFFHVFGAVLIPFYQGWAGLSLAQTLLLQSWFTFSIFILEVPTGVVADVFSRKASLVWSAIFTILGFAWYPLFNNFYSFMIGEFLIAMAVALRSGATEALLCDSVSKQDYQRVLPKMNSLSMLGIILGPIVGALLLNFLTPRQVVWIQTFPPILALLVALTILEPPIQKTNKSEITRVWTTFVAGISFFAKNKSLQLLAIDMAIVAGVAKMMVWLFQVVIEKSISPVWFGWIMSAAVVTELLVMNLHNRFAQKYSRHGVILITSLITASGFLLVGLSSNIYLLILGILLAIGFGMSRKPFFSVIFNEKINSQRATVLSTISMGSQLFLAILHPMIGYLADISVTKTLASLGLALIAFAAISGWKLRQIEL